MADMYKFKIWNPDIQLYQTIAMENDFEAIMYGLDHGLDIFENKEEIVLVYSPYDDFESNIERLKRYGIAMESNGTNISYKKIQQPDATVFEPREPISYLKDLLEDVTYAVEREDKQTAVHHVSDIINLKNVIEKYTALQIEVDHWRTSAESCQCDQ